LLGFETFTSQLDQVADEDEHSLIEHSLFACPNFDGLIYFSYSSWSNQDYTMSNASAILWKSATFFVESREFLCLISRWMGLMLLQRVAHILLNYSYGKERKNLNLELKVGKELKRLGFENVVVFVSDSSFGFNLDSTFSRPATVTSTNNDLQYSKKLGPANIVC